MNRDDLGRLVREVWIEWAREQPAPKPSWLVPWDDLSEPDREVDRRIGERLAAVGASQERAYNNSAAHGLRSQREEAVTAPLTPEELAALRVHYKWDGRVIRLLDEHAALRERPALHPTTRALLAALKAWLASDLVLGGGAWVAARRAWRGIGEPRLRVLVLQGFLVVTPCTSRPPTPAPCCAAPAAGCFAST